jgi:hypothetical protein
MMRKLKVALSLAALSLVATALLSINAQAQQPVLANTWFASGSSAQFNTMGIAAGLDNAWPTNNALCGEHHWTMKNGAILTDPRSGSILPEPGNIWIVWDNSTTPTRVCFYVSTDSIVGNRTFFAYAQASLVAGVAAGQSDNSSAAGTGGNGVDLVPLLGQGEALPTVIYQLFNGIPGPPAYPGIAVINVAQTDIRPEDAKFATIRAITPTGQRIPRNHYTGLGYTNPITSPIYSSQTQTSSSQANVVDFTISGLDPITGTGTINGNPLPRPYTTLSVGASPVMVIYNAYNTASGHLGDGNYTDINRWSLASALAGIYVHARQIAHASGEADTPLHIWQREPLSGTFNVMEFTTTLAGEMYPTYGGPGTIGQETNVNPANTACHGATPCTVESGNPWYHCTSAFVNGTSCGTWATTATRGRVIGTSEMIGTVNKSSAGVPVYPDSIGYAFWGFSNFNGTNSGNANGTGFLKYMTVDGVDPLYANPTGIIPQCVTSGSVYVSCPLLTFPNIANGTYPIWSVLRSVYDPTVSGILANAMVNYAQHAVLSTLPDFVPATSLQVFRSHFNQLIDDASDDQYPNNGYKSGVPETGGDMGGAVLTVQSELDYINDTGGNQQTNMFQ